MTFPEVPFTHSALLIEGAAVVDAVGDSGREYPWASVTKILTALAAAVAVERCHLSWDTPAGPPGATLTDLLSHASGLPLDSRQPQMPVGRRRIYSNAGIEMAAEAVAEATGTPFTRWLEEAVLEPLGMTARVDGSPAHSGRGSVRDLAALAGEFLAPALLTPATHERITTVQRLELAGVVPGYGRFDPCPWGLGVEIRGTKGDGGGHWTAPTSSPRTFGHFGQSGSFLWVDPDARLAGVFLGEEPFGAWHKENWATWNAAWVAGERH